MVQAAGRCPLKNEDQVWSQRTTWGICGGQVALGQDFLQVLQFSHQYHTTNAPQSHSLIYHKCSLVLTTERVIK